MVPEESFVRFSITLTISLCFCAYWIPSFLIATQSLHALSGTARAHARDLSNNIEKEEMTAVAFKMREKSCPRKYTDILDEKLE